MLTTDSITKEVVDAARTSSDSYLGHRAIIRHRQLCAPTLKTVICFSFYLAE